MEDLVPGDRVFVTMPSHQKGIFREYDFVVASSFDDQLVLCPLSDKSAWDQDPWENPWRRFLLTWHGLKIGFGADAQTYRPQKR